MPPKTIASILNNESNLKILEKLKKRPFYPRELAAEMKLSEPFIVRRLKAMEEYGIVEGRWETENGRKVKRYYPLDITMQLGKDGLKVTSGEVQVKNEIDMKKEAVKFLVYLPVIAFLFYGYYSGQTIILVISLIFIVWQIAINAVLYRAYHYMTMISAIALLAVAMLAIVLALALKYSMISLTAPSTWVGLAYGAFGFVFFMSLIYHIRFSQIEAQDLKSDKRELIESLDMKPLSTKMFFFLLVIRWRISEYFGLL